MCVFINSLFYHMLSYDIPCNLDTESLSFIAATMSESLIHGGDIPGHLLATMTVSEGIAFRKKVNLLSYI